MSRATKGRLNRRTFLKTTAATGLTAAAGVYCARRSRAVPDGQDRLCQSANRTARCLCGSGRLHHRRLFEGRRRPALQPDSKNYTFEVVVKDSQSNPNRAAEVAKELIVDDEIDIMVVAHTPETTNPVSTICEIEEIPCISTLAPWQPWFIGRQGNPNDPGTWAPFNFTYHFLWGLEDVTRVFMNMWNQLDTNKTVGGLFPNDADGNAWGDPNVGFPAMVGPEGYKLVDPGRYQNLQDDFSAQITAFKNASCDIVTGVVLPPDFATFWTQAAQQGFRPKAASVGKAILFPSAVNAIGDAAQNLSSEVWWSNVHPFASSINGTTAGQLCDAYESDTGKQWTQPLGFVHALFEIVVDTVKRVDSINDAEEVVNAISSTDLNTIVGPIRWDGNGLPPIAAKNVTKTPLVGGQWRKSDDGKFRIVIVDNKTYPDIPVAGDMQPIG